jgi:BASS family bile acid:Na+ symporter
VGSSYADYEYFLAILLLVVSMLGMGTTLTVGEFLQLARAPKGVFLVLAIQVLATPLLALLVARLLRTSPGITFGMLVIAALPGGMYSNLLTYLGRGNVALSISATAVCTVTCVATAPLILKVYGAELLPAGFSMPAARIFAEIGGCLIVPLLAGMAIRRAMPNYQGVIERSCIRASVVVLCVLVIGCIAAGRLDLATHGWRSPIALTLFAWVSLWLCYALGSLLRFSLPDQFTIGIEVVVRNGNLGLLLKAALFPAGGPAGDVIGDAVLYVVLLYSAVSLVVATVELVAKRAGLGFVYARKAPAVVCATQRGKAE